MANAAVAAELQALRDEKAQLANRLDVVLKQQQLQQQKQLARTESCGWRSLRCLAIVVSLVVACVAFIVPFMIPYLFDSRDGSPTKVGADLLAVLSGSNPSVTYRNGIRFDYYPLESPSVDHQRPFSIKRTVSVRITEHQNRASELARYSGASLAAAVQSQLIDNHDVTSQGGATHSGRLWRRGVVRVEAFVTAPNAPPSRLRSYNAVQAALRVANPACHHRRLAGLFDLHLPPVYYSARGDDVVVRLEAVDLYHCHAEFLTMPAALVGSATCRGDGTDRSAFCTSTAPSPTALAPGFERAEDETHELSSDRNHIAYMSEYELRSRPPSASLALKHESEWSMDECQDLRHEANKHRMIEQVAEGPRLDVLLPQSSVQILSTNPLVRSVARITMAIAAFRVLFPLLCLFSSPCRFS
jgi:hypothetical protein